MHKNITFLLNHLAQHVHFTWSPSGRPTHILGHQYLIICHLAGAPHTWSPVLDNLPPTSITWSPVLDNLPPSGRPHTWSPVLGHQYLIICHLAGAPHTQSLGPLCTSSLDISYHVTFACPLCGLVGVLSIIIVYMHICMLLHVHVGTF